MNVHSYDIVASRDIAIAVEDMDASLLKPYSSDPAIKHLMCLVEGRTRSYDDRLDFMNKCGGVAREMYTFSGKGGMIIFIVASTCRSSSCTEIAIITISRGVCFDRYNVKTAVVKADSDIFEVFNNVVPDWIDDAI